MLERADDNLINLKFDDRGESLEIKGSPATLGDHHLGAKLVELVPQLLLLKGHFWVVVHVLFLHRHPGRHASKGKTRKAGEHAGEASRGGKGVGGPKGEARH